MAMMMMMMRMTNHFASQGQVIIVGCDTVLVVVASIVIVGHIDRCGNLTPHHGVGYSCGSKVQWKCLGWVVAQKLGERKEFRNNEREWSKSRRVGIYDKTGAEEVRDNDNEYAVPTTPQHNTNWNIIHIMRSFENYTGGRAIPRTKPIIRFKKTPFS